MSLSTLILLRRTSHRHAKLMHQMDWFIIAQISVPPRHVELMYMLQTSCINKTPRTRTITLLIGDAMVKHIDPNKLSRRKTIVCKSIPGTKIDDAFDITKDLVETHQVSEIIIHLGTNNLTSVDEPNEIVAKMASFCDNLLKSFTMLKTITISTIIHRSQATPYLTWKTHRVNAAFKLLANQRSWSIVDNDCIDVDSHIAVDGVHLNHRGVKAYTRNLIRHLRSTVSEESSPFRHRLDWHRRKKTPRGGEFPRDWMDCLQTANTLLGQSH